MVWLNGSEYAWTESQLQSFVIVVRISSTFSLVGALFIIITFCMSKSFHKPINRLAFFAAFGNVITNFATMVAQDGIKKGCGSGLCTVQGALINWFMVSDALFVSKSHLDCKIASKGFCKYTDYNAQIACMALNTYLTVCKKFTAARLKKLEIYYVTGCYGIPFVPAVTYAFIRNKEGVPVYGPATFWCWISPEWPMLRIGSFYGPVW